MRLFTTLLLLPIAVMAQNSYQGGQVVGNVVGEVLGLFAMCGTSPVDCGNGWCCLAGQTCTSGKNGPNTMCNDNSLISSSGQTGVTVNAAYFGKETDNQVQPSGNGTTAPKTSGTLTSSNSVSTGAGMQLSMPANWVLVSTLLGSTSLIMSML